MSIYTSIQLECDNCHRVEDDLQVGSESWAQKWADEHGWSTIGDNHYCPECRDLDEIVKLVEGY